MYPRIALVQYFLVANLILTITSMKLELYGAHTPCAASQLHAARQLLTCFVFTVSYLYIAISTCTEDTRTSFFNFAGKEGLYCCSDFAGPYAGGFEGVQSNPPFPWPRPLLTTISSYGSVEPPFHVVCVRACFGAIVCILFVHFRLAVAIIHEY